MELSFKEAVEKKKNAQAEIRRLIYELRDLGMYVQDIKYQSWYNRPDGPEGREMKIIDDIELIIAI